MIKRLVFVLLCAASCSGQANPKLWYTVDNTVSIYNGLNFCANANQVTSASGLLTETLSSGTFTCNGKTESKSVGAIVSTPFYFTYGTVKVTAKFPPTGVHSVLWMWGGAPGTSGYPPTCIAAIKARTSTYQTACTSDSNTAYEIDFGEFMPASIGTQSVNQWAHTWVNNVRSDPAGGAYNAGVDLTQGFHIYEIDWTPTTLTWKFDGVATRSYIIPNGTWNQPMYLIVDEWYDSYGGTNGAYPLSMQVKSVQVWDQNNRLIFSDTFGAGPKGRILGKALITGKAVLQ